MHLIALVVAGQRVHDQVRAETVGEGALPRAARHHRKGVMPARVQGPGAGPIVPAAANTNGPAVARYRDFDNVNLPLL